MHARILFEDPAQCFEEAILHHSSAAPVVFTGQRLRGILIVFYDQEASFDVAQLVIRGK